ncbi:MAG: NADH-dependent [FeFe] hydrogenase, group A6 [Clostridiales bacterium]|nr:NADH-dependent [FeFe] hydrogenase, group A6 [Clostridiales bacterium]
MQMVNITIDGIKAQVPSNYTVLKAAKSLNIDIPTLCYLKGINEVGACRMCVVEVERARTLQASCVLPVSEGMVVKTNTFRVREARKMVLELILARHNRECTICPKNLNCELQRLCDEMNIKEVPYEPYKMDNKIDDLSPSIVRDPSKCILCGRCVNVCKKVQGVGVIDFTMRGIRTTISPAFGKSLNEVGCINCGQCIKVCPVGALSEKDDTEEVWRALSDPDMHVIVQTAPAVRVGLGEEFGMERGAKVTGKMVTALRRLGFDKVFDTDFGADLTIMEEGTELLNRIKNGGKLPMITSCSPGWIKFCEHYFPEFLDNLSTCKSPHEMFGAIAKTYYAKKAGIDSSKIFVVSIMPCTAKKFECKRPELSNNGLPDVDVVLTTRELAKMIKEARINFVKLEDSKFDNILGESTGAAVIFGVTGGVMEAALRTVSEVATGKELGNIEFTSVRGFEGIKEAQVDIGDMKVKVAVAHGTGNAKKLLERIKNGEADYQFIEIMGCPGGCINGGGQPFIEDKDEIADSKVKRMDSIYEIDRSMPIRKSHENHEVKVLYDEFLGKPNSSLAHELLHTHYTKRSRF